MGVTAIKTPTHRRDNPSPGSMRSQNQPMSPLTQRNSMHGAGCRHVLKKEERDRPPPESVQSGINLQKICDYDRSVTQLYEMLESSQWENASARCYSHPEEVRTWVVRRDATGNTRWKLLPLHAAVIFEAPLSLVEDLLRHHPVAAAKRDDQGILPLHLAFRHKSEEAVIEKLLHQYPGGVMIKDHRERFPLDHGKEMVFSAKLMGVYAETFTKCQPAGKEAATNESEITTTYENRMNALKDAYEARIDSIEKDHEQTIATLTIKAEQDLKNDRENNNQEVVELRSLLAKEKVAGQKIPELESELRGLSSSLGDATSELVKLRKVVQEQKDQKGTLVDEMRQLLKDQNFVNDRCNKQQEQLDQGQKLREQLLRTLLQKNDGKAIEVAKEIYLLSNKNISRTEMLLKNLLSNEFDDIGDLPVDSRNPSPAAPLSANAPAALPPPEDHGDDISAITESSYLQPFGDI